MPYDRSWMGYGTVGALQAGAIALVVGIVMYALVRAFGKRNGWSHGKELSVAYLLTVVVAGGQDIGNLVYFSMAPLQSLVLLKAKLALVHDPDSIGLRVFFEIVGGLLGACIGWAMFSGELRKLFGGMRQP